MRIALVGYGKMGRLIDTLAFDTGHEVVARIDQTSDPAWDELSGAQVAIEFSGPAWAPENLKRLAKAGLPTVCGTTGWDHSRAQVVAAFEATTTSLLTGSNFSVGVNLLFLLNRQLAKWMAGLADYDPAVEERHHNQKADGPSGTARTLALDILAHLPRKTTLANPGELALRPPTPEELSVSFTRAGGIHGAHTVLYTSPVDTLTIAHEAHSRAGFARGALLAAAWLLNNAGIHRFEEVFPRMLAAE